MEEENVTLLTEFVLTGLTHQPQWKIPVFLVLYVDISDHHCGEPHAYWSHME
jgi:hypothetical protein